jgi:hypothetical protein
VEVCAGRCKAGFDEWIFRCQDDKSYSRDREPANCTLGLKAAVNHDKHNPQEEKKEKKEEEANSNKQVPMSMLNRKSASQSQGLN